jgi:hypothetical protein
MALEKVGATSPGPDYSSSGHSYRAGDKIAAGSNSATLQKRKVEKGATLDSMVRDANPGASAEQLHELTAKAKEANGLHGGGIPAAFASMLIPQLDSAPAPANPAARPGTALPVTSSYGAAREKSAFSPDTTSGHATDRSLVSEADFLPKMGPKQPPGELKLDGLPRIQALLSAAAKDPRAALEAVRQGNARALVESLARLNPQAAGSVFAQALPEQLVSCLDQLGPASTADKRKLVPQFLDAMAKAEPPCQLSKDVLCKLDDSALRSLAAHAADASPGSQALISSGLLGELVQRAEDNPKNAMAVMEALSRLSPAALTPALSDLGVDREMLSGWMRAAAASDPMSATGSWVNPETVQRLAGKLAQQPGGIGVETAKALLSTALAGQTERGGRPDAGLKKSLEDLTRREQIQPSGATQQAGQPDPKPVEGRDSGTAAVRAAAAEGSPLAPLARDASARQVSEHLAAVPEAERGRVAAELLAKGSLTAEQLAGYVAGTETGKTSSHTALARAATLLGSSEDPALRKAIVQTLDKLLPAQFADTEAVAAATGPVKAFEDGVQQLFESGKVSEQGKARLVSAMQDSSNPTVRSAMALQYSQHLEVLSDQLTRLRGSDFDAVLRESHRHPDPKSVRRFVAEQRAKLEQLEKLVPTGQAALGSVLAGPEDWKPGTDPNTPQTALGQFAHYLEDFHQNDQRTQAKGVMRALFNPAGGVPSGAAMDCFATLTKRAREADNMQDGDALGFFLEAGVQACGVSQTKEEQAQAQLMTSAIQVAVVAGLGWGGVAAAQALGVDKALGKAMDQAFRAGFSRVGQENLNGMLSGMGKNLSAKEDQWHAFRDVVHRSLRGSSITQGGYVDGIKRFRWVDR